MTPRTTGLPSHIHIAGRRIGADSPTFIIAELSANHLGRLDRALELIRAAKTAGADAVKIQTYTADTITIRSDAAPFRIQHGTLWDGRTLHDLYAEAHTPWNWHPALFEEARARGIICFSSPFDPTAIEFLEHLGVPAFKIASPELVDLPLIRLAAATGKPLIISTGMATIQEIQDAVDAAMQGGAREISILRTCSAYPSPPDEMNLQTIPHLRKTFNVPIGLSDHTLTTEIPAAAVALGARVIEKHLTFRRADGGPDAAFSLEPDEFARMVQAVRATERALGRVHYGPGPMEQRTLPFRRSLFIVKDVPAGTALTSDAVRSIRPAKGLPPKYLDFVLGKRTTQDLVRGTPLAWEHIKATPPSEPPPLAGPNVWLRPLDEADLNAEYLAWLNDPEVNRYLEVRHVRQDERTLRKYYERFLGSKNNFIFAIVDRPTALHIGNVTINDFDPNTGVAHTGLIIGRKEFWGRGLAGEAWALALQFAFERVGVRKMVAGAIEDNRASIKVLESLGFKVEGRLRREASVDGEPRDTLRFGLLPEEFRGPRRRAP